MARSRIPRRFRGVRARLTATATSVAVIAVCLAGFYLVQGVESSLSRQLRSEEEADAAELVAAMETGQAPQNIDQALLAEVAQGGQSVQIMDAGGTVIAATPDLATSTTAVAAPNPDGDSTAAEEIVSGLTAGEESTVRSHVSVDGSSYTVIVSSSLEPVRQGVQAVRHGLFVALPALVAAVAALTWYVAGRALRPVEAIRAEVERIGGSTLSRRVPSPGSADEVDRLAGTMNSMLDRLESAAIRQQQFVADASHELRSPVTAIRAHLEVARYSTGPEDWEVVLDEMLAEEARLEATIADLLTSATLEEGAPIADARPVDMVGVACKVAARPRSLASAVEISTSLSDVAMVVGSGNQLERAVANLVDNAARFARSRVQVRVELGDGHVLVMVDDDGPGIAVADRERVFERFIRLDAHRARGHTETGAGGAGLGLSLVRQIAERHGGTVHIEGSELGGARFVLRLPAGR